MVDSRAAQAREFLEERLRQEPGRVKLSRRAEVVPAQDRQLRAKQLLIVPHVLRIDEWNQIRVRKEFFQGRQTSRIVMPRRAAGRDIAYCAFAETADADSDARSLLEAAGAPCVP